MRLIDEEYTSVPALAAKVEQKTYIQSLRKEPLT
jgi:hypothetical protein